MNKFECVTPLSTGMAFHRYGVYGFDPFGDDKWDECLRRYRELDGFFQAFWRQ